MVHREVSGRYALDLWPWTWDPGAFSFASGLDLEFSM